MNGKSGSVNVGFQKVLTEVYEVMSFLNWHCVLAEINFSGFGMNGLCRTLLKTRRARLSKMLVFCDWV